MNQFASLSDEKINYDELYIKYPSFKYPALSPVYASVLYPTQNDPEGEVKSLLHNDGLLGEEIEENEEEKFTRIIGNANYPPDILKLDVFIPYDSYSYTRILLLTILII